MNVFIPYADTFATAKILDSRRLHKQILECDQMIRAIEGTSRAYRNHPCTLMYSSHVEWLGWYRDVLKAYRKKDTMVEAESALCDLLRSEPQRPLFIGLEPLHRAHRARLFQKDAMHYACFEADRGFTDLNWYVVGNEIRKYRNGKLIEIEPLS